MPLTLRLATRGSQLALTQARQVADVLAQTVAGSVVELVEIRTRGDRDQKQALHTLGGYGVFTREVDQAVLDGRADAAVHSLKDLPTTLAETMVLAAVPVREATWDMLVGPGAVPIETLPAGSTIATGALRRKAQLLRQRPDLNIVPVRGNVDTRLRKVAENGWAGTILAKAGLNRLSVSVEAVSLQSWMLPAVGQGALALTCLAANESVRQWLAGVEDPASRRQVDGERSFLKSLNAGCHAPVGVCSQIDGSVLSMEGAVFAVDGTREVRSELSGDMAEAEALGAALARGILDQGGGDLLG